MNNVCFLADENKITQTKFLTDIASVTEQIKLYSAEKVLLFNPDSYCFSVQFFALVLAGCDVLLPPNEQPGTLAQLSPECDATMGTIYLVDKPAIHSAVNVTLEPLHGVDKLTKVAFTPSLLNIDDLFSRLTGQVTFYTSGSTGRPKGIVKLIDHIIAELDTLASTFSSELQNANMVLSTVSHQHIYGLLFKVFLPLKSGLTIVNQSFEYPEHIDRYLEKSSTGKLALQALLISSPAHLKRLVIDNVLIAHKQRISAVFSSGGPLSFETSQQFSDQMAVAPIEVFGSTETGGIAWRKGQVSEKAAWSIFAGIRYKAISCADSSIEKRLEISSPFIEQSNYLTDDLIEPIDSCHFHLLGRADRTIKLEEKRINLLHVERCLLSHPWINAVRILVLANTSQVTQRQILASVVEVNQVALNLIEQQGKRALNEKFKQHLLTEFERICLPKKWRYITNFPYNSQGKITLSELEKLFD